MCECVEDILKVERLGDIYMLLFFLSYIFLFMYTFIILTYIDFVLILQRMHGLLFYTLGKNFSSCTLLFSICSDLVHSDPIIYCS